MIKTCLLPVLGLVRGHPDVNPPKAYSRRQPKVAHSSIRK